MFSKSLPVIGVGIAIILSGITGSSAAEDNPQAPSPEAEKATVVSTIVKRPARVVHRAFKVHLNPRPSVPEVHAIINHEAALWRVPAGGLSARVACESQYHYWATNGQYSGVLQFSYGTFWRGMRTIGSLRYVTRVVKIRRMHSRVYRVWSDGKTTRGKGRIVRQRVITRRVGQIPRTMNTHAQIRIGAQAIRGISAVRSSEWSCGA